MAKSAYNNTINANTDQILYKFNRNYYSQILFENNNDFYTKFNLIKKMPKVLKNLMIICQQNLHQVQNIKNKQIVKYLSLAAIYQASKFG